MSCSYSVYLGAYLKLDDASTIVKRTKMVCPECGKEYKTDEKFCINDGKEVIQKEYKQQETFSSWYCVQDAYPALKEFSEEDEFTSPEGIEGVFISNYCDTYDYLSDEDKVVELDDINKYIIMFKKKHNEVLTAMTEAGIGYSIKVGAIGSWG